MEANIREKINRPADWEPATTAEVSPPPRTAPRKEIARFAGQTLTVETAIQLEFEASQEGMGV